jgi:hypothetical protein
MANWYDFGTATVGAGGTTVTLSAGALALQNIRVGDGFVIKGASFPPVEILTVPTNLTFTIDAWPYTAQTGVAYTIQPGPAWSSTAAVAQDVSEYLAAISGVQNSDTTNTVGTGAKTWYVQPNLRLSVGARVRFSDIATPTTRYMDGVVTSYAGRALTLDVDKAIGSGSASSWNVNFVGEPGSPSNVLSIGTVTTGAAGSSAAASIGGTPPNQVISLTIPRGDTGSIGATGIPGAASDLTIGTVTTGAAGSSAAATISGSPPSQILNLTIPRGDTGASGSGSGNVTGPASSVANHIALFDNTSGTLLKDGGALSSFGASLVDDADAAAARTTLGLGTLATQSGTFSDAGLTANPLSQFAATTSAQLRGVISDETGTGAAYFQGGDLGTPSAGVLTNCTGLPVAGGGTGGTTAQTARAGLSAASFDAGAALGLLTNPFFEISQENGTAAGTANGVNYYAADEWLAIETSPGALVLSAQNVADPFSGTSGYKRLKNSFKVTATTGQASFAADDQLQSFKQSIEGSFWKSLGWGTSDARACDAVMVVYVPTTASYSLILRSPDASRSYSKLVSLTAGINVIFETFPGDTSGSWPTGAVRSAQILFAGIAGATNTSPSNNAWISGAYCMANGGTNWASTTSQYVQVAYCQIFPSGVLPFTSAAQITGEALQLLLNMRRAYDDEMRRCQRYYYKHPFTQFMPIATGFCYTTTNALATVRMPVPMRTTPVLATSSASHFAVYNSGGSDVALTAFSLNSFSSADVVRLDATTASGLVAGNATLITMANASTTLSFSARF